MKKYYAVTTKCGHVGKGKFINVTFAISAEDGKEAAEIGRWLPRVKHHYKYCITDVKCISYDDYLELCEENNNNPYLKCKNVQEQNETCPNIYDNVETLDYLIQEPKKVYKEKRKQRVEFILKKKKIMEAEFKRYQNHLKCINVWRESYAN